MTAITLTRHDRDRNMARFYRLDVQPDLFGCWAVWREWGRIGAAGTIRRDAFSTREAADAAQAQLVAAKVRRGYGPCGKPQNVPRFN